MKSNIPLHWGTVHFFQTAKSTIGVKKKGDNQFHCAEWAVKIESY
jgi:hypothetical protein